MADEERKTDGRLLSESLKECADSLSRETEADEGAPLRRVQRLARSLMFDSEDAYIRTISFIIDEWVKDYYLNFAGDIFSPAEEDIERIRAKLLHDNVSPALKALSVAVANEERSETLKGVEALTTSYLDSIDETKSFVGGW